MKLSASSLFASGRAQGSPVASAPAPSTPQNDYEPLLEAPKSDVHLINDIPLKTKNGQYTMVVEIKAGERAKFETDHKTGQLFHEIKKGKPRYIQYLGYPTAYGFFPQTVGLDKDPLDSLYLGDVAGDRGGKVHGHVIGAINMVDDGEADYKILLAPDRGPFAGIKDIGDLPAGTGDILQTWFRHYKRNDQVQIDGLLSKDDAMGLVDEAHARWQAEQSQPKQKSLALVG